MSSEEYTAISRRLDRLERLALIGAKTVLNLDEVVLLTGYSKGHIYRLTSEQRIPHFKHNRTLYFKKDEVERWLLETKIPTKDEIDSAASTYVATH